MDSTRGMGTTGPLTPDAVQTSGSRTLNRLAALGVAALVGLTVMTVTLTPDWRRPSQPPPIGPGVESAEAPSPEEVDRAVERGLRWLADQQAPNGAWTGATGHKRGDGYVVFYDEEWQAEFQRGHPGVTALAGLAFLANGQLPGRGLHGKTLARVLDYLLDCTGSAAYITDAGSRMYSHSFSVLLLSQVHGMTRRRSEEIEEKLREACRFVVSAQNAHGAWRYTPGMLQSDLSVTVCQVQALRAARNVGIHVPKVCIDRVVRYVKKSRIEHGRERGAFYYKIHGRAARTKTSFTVNAAAATCLHSAGVFDDALDGPALEYVEDRYDEVSTYYPDHYFFWYGNYYAVQAMQMQGGKRWERYWKKISRDLVRRQGRDGRWPNSVGPGDAFSTAMACLILRVPLGYLPIFRH